MTALVLAIAVAALAACSGAEVGIVGDPSRPEDRTRLEAKSPLFRVRAVRAFERGF